MIMLKTNCECQQSKLWNCESNILLIETNSNYTLTEPLFLRFCELGLGGVYFPALAPEKNYNGIRQK